MAMWLQGSTREPCNSPQRTEARRGAKMKRRKFGFADGERASGGDEPHAEEPARKERVPPAARRGRKEQMTEEEEFFRKIFGDDKGIDGSRLVEDADYLPTRTLPASTGRCRPPPSLLRRRPAPHSQTAPLLFLGPDKDPVRSACSRSTSYTAAHP